MGGWQGRPPTRDPPVRRAGPLTNPNVAQSKRMYPLCERGQQRRGPVTPWPGQTPLGRGIDVDVAATFLGREADRRYGHHAHRASAQPKPR